MTAIKVEDKTIVDGKFYNTNHLVSVYGKKNPARLLADAIVMHSDNNKTLYYLDKKKASGLSGIQRLQLPKSISPDGFVSKIHDPASPVKTEFIEQINTPEFAGALSQDVADNLGITRPKLNISQYLKYSLPTNRKQELDVQSDDGEPLTQGMEGGTVAKYSFGSWRRTDVSKVRQSLIDKGFDENDVDKWINDVNSIAAIIGDDRTWLGYKP